MPIDYFLHSLAASAQDRAIGVILSGTASDGTAGVREIKAVGGITIAQHPETAKYDGMPRAAIASGFVDLVLSPPKSPPSSSSIIRHPLKQSPVVESSTTLPAPDRAAAAPEPQMDQIFALLRTASGVDFRELQARHHRAAAAAPHGAPRSSTSLEHYVRYPRENAAGSASALRRHPDPRHPLLPRRRRLRGAGDGHPAEDPRDASPTSSRSASGYRAARPARRPTPSRSCILEPLPSASRGASVQVFATDISDASIDKARAGTYPESIAVDVSPERLRRFFTKIDGGYRISKAVRDVCVFARQDLTRDPPFSQARPHPLPERAHLSGRTSCRES